MNTVNMMDVAIGTKAVIKNTDGGVDFLIGEVVVRVPGNLDDDLSVLFASIDEDGLPTKNGWYCGAANIELIKGDA
jgi:hypothetical protein